MPRQQQYKSVRVPPQATLAFGEGSIENIAHSYPDKAAQFSGTILPLSGVELISAVGGERVGIISYTIAILTSTNLTIDLGGAGDIGFTASSPVTYMHNFYPAVLWGDLSNAVFVNNLDVAITASVYVYLKYLSQSY